jgi:hypothetical protein
MQDFKVEASELALEKAAKMICTMKTGLCPIHEEIRPWQCWVIHFKSIAEH